MNFVASVSLRSSLFCCSLLASGVIGLAGCNSDPTPITSQTSKYEVADGEGTTSAATPASGSSAATSPATSPRTAAPGSVDAGSFDPGEPSDNATNSGIAAASPSASSAANSAAAPDNADAGPNK